MSAGTRKSAAGSQSQRLASTRETRSSIAGSEAGDDVPKGNPTEEALVRRFEEASVPSPQVAARQICSLLADPQSLGPEHLEMIYRHHRLRLRNTMMQATMRLTLWETDQSHASGMAGDCKRPLTPEGWVQVTRSAWALRRHPEWTPGLILVGLEQACRQSAERLHSVALDEDEDEDDGPQEPEPTPPPGPLVLPADPGAPKRKKHRPPPPRPCEALVWPGYWKGLGPESYRAVDALVGAMKESDVKKAPVPTQPPFTRPE
eukprot:CAMPEP_0117599302 /NCGR_PEP_ID=MMETSP0784-20121206/75873_1 /TAXON_ID=39447 /ORGANISM="" /LENGTH=260 /DNA_ID=CAMNT_0005401841 /DNA_START=44 /DNA_END=823 /DNA_ORIENTATION=-